jgi:hypothetical protein
MLLPSSTAGCNGMLPLSATLSCHWQHSQCTIILPPGAIQSCHLIRTGLDCQIRRSAAAMATPVGATRSKVRFVRDPEATPSKSSVRQADFSFKWKSTQWKSVNTSAFLGTRTHLINALAGSKTRLGGALQESSRCDVHIGRPDDGSSATRQRISLTQGLLVTRCFL